MKKNQDEQHREEYERVMGDLWNIRPELRMTKEEMYKYWPPEGVPTSQWDRFNHKMQKYIRHLKEISQ